MPYLYRANQQPMYKIGNKKLRCILSSVLYTFFIMRRFYFKVEFFINKNGVPNKVLYDEVDHELVCRYSWYMHPRGYVMACIKNEHGIHVTVRMHRLILGVVDSKILVDHKNRDPKDNRRENLRVCTYTQNNCNVAAWGKSSYLGVALWKSKFVAGIRINKKRKHLGTFSSEIEAAKAYDNAAKAVHGEFANLNFK